MHSFFKKIDRERASLVLLRSYSFRALPNPNLIPCIASKWSDMTKTLYARLSFMLSSRGALKIILILLTQKFTKRIVNMCEKFWENKLTDFWFMDFTSNWHDPGQSMDKPTRVW